MAMTWNPQTKQYEDEFGASLATQRPLSHGFDVPPDEVSPSDLILGTDPRKPYSNAIPLIKKAPTPPAEEEPAMVNTGFGWAPAPKKKPSLLETARAEAEEAIALGLPPGTTRAGTAPGSAPPAFLAGGATGGSSGSSGDFSGPPVAPAATPAPAPAPAKPVSTSGGGGGGAAMPTGQLTAAEAVAQGGQEIAQDAEIAATREGADVAAARQRAMAEQTAAQEKAIGEAQTAWQAKRADSEKRLQAREDAASKMKITDIFEGRPLAGIAAAIAAGIGAKAAAITGTENTALRVLESGAKAHREKQQAYYERELAGIKGDKDRLEYATMAAAADEAGLYRRFEMERTKLLQTYGAEEERIKGDKMIAAFQSNYAAAKTEQARMLEERGRTAVVQMAQVASARASANAANAQAQQTRVETANLVANGGKAITHVEREKAEAAEAGANQMAAAAKRIEGDPKAWKRLQVAMKEQKEADALAKTRFGGDAVGLARYLGQSAAVVEQRLKGDPAALEMYSSLAPVAAAKARQLDPVGALNEGALHAGWDHLGALTRDPASMVKEIRVFESEKRNLAKAALGGSSYQAPSAQQPVSRAQLGVYLSEAQARLQKNPNDPVALRAMTKINALMGAAR